MVLETDSETATKQSRLTVYTANSYSIEGYTINRLLNVPMQVGLEGEALSLHTISGSSSVEWVEGPSLAQKQPMTWYKVIKIFPISQQLIPFHCYSISCVDMFMKHFLIRIIEFPDNIQCTRRK